MADPSRQSHLTAAMIAQLVEAVRAGGLAVEQLTLPASANDSTAGAEIQYRPTGSRIHFSYWPREAATRWGISPGHYITLEPGDQFASESFNALRWDEVLKKVTRWASLVRREEAAIRGDTLPPLVSTELTLNKQSVQHEQQMRDAFLRKLYEIQKLERPHELYVELSDVTDRMELDSVTASRITDYLLGERLIEWVAFGTIAITHAGVRYVESAIAGYDSRSRGASTNIMHINNSGTLNVGALIHGSSNQVQLSGVSLSNSILADLSLISNAIALLPPKSREEASEVLADLKAELQAPSPKTSRVKAFGAALMRLLEGVATNVVSDAVKRAAGLLP